MLSPESRQLYTDAFRVPEGYRFDCGVGTTFALDLETLLFVPLALSSGAPEDPTTALNDPVALLGGIHRAGEKLTVFFDDGHMNSPSFTHSLFSLLEESVIPARARGDGAIFHPKLWLLRFVHAADGHTLLRAVVLSRNITTSRCWDTVVQLEGSPNARQIVGASKELAKLVRALPSLVAKEGVRPTQDRLRQLELLASEAERTDFAAPPPFESVEFLALGTGDGAQWKHEGGSRVLGISPFVSKAALRTLAKLAPSRCLVSRAEELDKHAREPLTEWDCRYLAEAAGGETDVAETDDAASADVAPHGLHAKALVIESTRRTTWWLGSGNLTDPVVNGSHVELLVRLEGPTRQVGIEPFLEGGFGALLRAYDLDKPQRSETDREKAERLAERVQHLVVRATLEGKCSAASSDTWNLILRGQLELPEGASLSAHPLTLPPTSSRAWSDAGLEFAGLAMESLTSFVVFRVEARFEATVATLSFTCRLPVSGLPEGRIDRVVRSVIADKNALLRYLQRVLADVDDSAFDARQGLKASGLGNDRAGDETPGVLLENIVRALRRKPDRLRAIDKTLQHLRADASGKAAVPSDLLELWDAIRAVLPVDAASSQKGDSP